MKGAVTDITIKIPLGFGNAVVLQTMLSKFIMFATYSPCPEQGSFLQLLYWRIFHVSVVSHLDEIDPQHLPDVKNLRWP